MKMENQGYDFKVEDFDDVRIDTIFICLIVFERLWFVKDMKTALVFKCGDSQSYQGDLEIDEVMILNS